MRRLLKEFGSTADNAVDARKEATPQVAAAPQKESPTAGVKIRHTESLLKLDEIRLREMLPLIFGPTIPQGKKY